MENQDNMNPADSCDTSIDDIYSIIPDKPFKNYEELAEILKSKNITIDNAKLNEVIKILSSVSYYTLVNGYKRNLISDPTSNDDHFMDGIKIEDLENIYLYEIEFNSMMLKYILFFEHSLKTKLAYLISKKYGVITYIPNNEHDAEDAPTRGQPADYLDESHYRRSSKNVIVKIRKQILTEKSKRNSPTFYYIDNKNHLPPWILINDLTLGMAISWFEILKMEDKKEIVKNLCPKLCQFSDSEFHRITMDMLKFIRDYRNAIAHGNKLNDYVIKRFIISNDLDRLFNNRLRLNQNQKLKNFTYLLAVLILFIDNKKIHSMLLYDVNENYKRYLSSKICDNSLPKIIDLPENLFDIILSYILILYASK